MVRVLSWELTRRTFLIMTSTVVGTVSGCLSAAESERNTPACLGTGTLSLRAAPDTRSGATQDTSIPVVAVTLSNGPGCVVEMQPGWRIKQADSEEQEVIASGEKDVPVRRLQQDESHTWLLYQGSRPGGATETGTTLVDVSSLPDGRFVFVVTGLAADQLKFTRSAEFTKAALEVSH